MLEKDGVRASISQCSFLEWLLLHMGSMKRTVMLACVNVIAEDY